METSTTAMNEMGTMLRAAQTRLATELAALPGDAWTKPSPCAGWTLATIVAHLVVQGDLFVGVIRMARAGQDGPPPPLTATTRAEYYTQRDALIANEVQHGPTELLMAFKRSADDFNAAVESLTEADLMKPAYNWGGGTRPLQKVLTSRLFELAIHHWDIRRSLTPEARIPDELTPFLVDHLQSSLSGFYKGSGEAGPIRVELIGQKLATMVLSTRDGALSVAEVDGTPTASSVRVDPQTIALVAAGRLRAGETVPGGTWQIEGDGDAARNLFAGFTGF